MATQEKKKFMALFLAPGDVMAEWAKTDPETRKVAEEKMRADWNRWMEVNAKMILSTEAAGKTKAVTTAGVGDTRNDIMLYSFVDADSHEAAAKAFADHPHLGIPKASIQIMEVRALGPM